MKSKQLPVGRRHLCGCACRLWQFFVYSVRGIDNLLRIREKAKGKSSDIFTPWETSGDLFYRQSTFLCMISSHLSTIWGSGEKTAAATPPPIWVQSKHGRALWPHPVVTASGFKSCTSLQRENAKPEQWSYTNISTQDRTKPATISSVQWSVEVLV